MVAKRLSADRVSQPEMNAAIAVGIAIHRTPTSQWPCHRPKISAGLHKNQAMAPNINAMIAVKSLSEVIGTPKPTEAITPNTPPRMTEQTQFATPRPVCCNMLTLGYEDMLR